MGRTKMRIFILALISQSRGSETNERSFANPSNPETLQQFRQIANPRELVGSNSPARSFLKHLFTNIFDWRTGSLKDRIMNSLYGYGANARMKDKEVKKDRRKDLL